MRTDPTPDLSVRQLRAVMAVAEHRSFIAAAASLKVSQPALTRTIQQVEVTLGVNLFTRTTRQVIVTDAGRELSALAGRVLSDLRIGVGSIRKHEAETGQVIVASVLSLAGALLPSLIGDYNRKFRGIEIHLREGVHPDVLDDIRSGVADFGVAYIDRLPENIIADNLGVEHFHVVVPKTSEYARYKTIDLATLKDATFVSFPAESHTRRAIDHAAMSKGLSLRYAATTNRLPTLFGLVRNGVGIAVVPASERPALSDRTLVSRPLSGLKLTARLGIVRLRERELSPAAAALLAVATQWLRSR